MTTTVFPDDQREGAFDVLTDDLKPEFGSEATQLPGTKQSMYQASKAAGIFNCRRHQFFANPGGQGAGHSDFGP